jgi:D-aminopeptidase
MQVERTDVAFALEQALASIGTSVPPPEGSVGAGTGMSCLGFKGGIGTASRVAPNGHTVGVLLLTNFGERQRLTIEGVPVGRVLGPAAPGLGGPRGTPPAGSCIGIVVTDAPVDHAGCERLARRVGLGLARTGSTAHHGSGEIFLACSTGLEVDEHANVVSSPYLSGPDLDPLFEAVVDATEEAVLNSLLMSPTMIGRGGHMSPGLPADQVVEILRARRGSRVE